MFLNMLLTANEYMYELQRRLNLDPGLTKPPSSHSIQVGWAGRISRSAGPLLLCSSGVLLELRYSGDTENLGLLSAQ